MKLSACVIMFFAVLLAFSPPVLGQDAASSTNGLTRLLDKIDKDFKAGNRTETALSNDLDQFDILLLEENGRRTEQAANILLSKGMIYSEILDDPEQAKTCFLEIKSNYSNTIIAGKLDPLMAMMDQQEDTKRALVISLSGSAFPDFNVTNLDGKPMSVSQYKGKVVLVEFWATWSETSQAELPNVQTTYEEFHNDGFEIIGVSLDEDRDKLMGFAKDKHIRWPQFFDGQRFQNKLAIKYGIATLPANFLIDSNGNVIGTNLTGRGLPLAVAKALAK